MIDLLKNMKHTVLAAWNVGFEHKWIDALRIVQICSDDRQREAATMASVSARLD